MRLRNKTRAMMFVTLAVIFSFVSFGGVAAAQYAEPPGQTPNGPSEDPGSGGGGEAARGGVGANGLARTGGDISGLLALAALLLLIGVIAKTDSWIHERRNSIAITG